MEPLRENAARRPFLTSAAVLTLKASVLFGAVHGLSALPREAGALGKEIARAQARDRIAFRNVANLKFSGTTTVKNVAGKRVEDIRWAVSDKAKGRPWAVTVHVSLPLPGEARVQWRDPRGRPEQTGKDVGR